VGVFLYATDTDTNLLSKMSGKNLAVISIQIKQIVFLLDILNINILITA